MDLETSIKKYESALRVYRFLYTFFDLATTFFTLFIIFSLTNMEDIFSIITAFEPYTGSKYNVFGLEVIFETLGIIFVEFFLSILITIIRYRRKEKKDAIKIIEEIFPALNERLRTAYDNRNVENIIVKDLIGAVTIDIKSIKPSTLLNKRLLIIGIGSMLITGSGSTYVAVQDVHTDFSPTDLEEVIENIPYISGPDSDLFPAGESGGTSDGNEAGEDLFGEPAVIVVEGTEVDLKIPPGAGQGFTVKDEGEERNEDFLQSAAYDPEAVASQAYYENLPEGYRSIIQSYFEELAEE